MENRSDPHPEYTDQLLSRWRRLTRHEKELSLAYIDGILDSRA